MAWWSTGCRGGPGAGAPDDLAPLLTIGGVLTRADVPALCWLVGAVHRASAPVALHCDLRRVANHDLRAVDVVARLRLCGKRHGCDLRFIEVPLPLLAVLDIAGASAWLAPPGGGHRSSRHDAEATDELSAVRPSPLDSRATHDRR